MVEIKNTYNILVRKSEEKRPIGTLRRRWKYNIRMDFKGNRVGNVDWMHVAQDGNQWQSLLKTVINLRVP
jgi:hypothetical protein